MKNPRGENRAGFLFGGCSAYQWPVFGIDDHGSCGGSALPFCRSSIECRSGDRMNAMRPSRGAGMEVRHEAPVTREMIAGLHERLDRLERLVELVIRKLDQQPS